MAQVSVIESSILANRDAIPQIPNPLYGAGRSFRKKAVVATKAADSATSQYGFFSLPSSCHLDSVELSTAAQGTSCAMNLGLYETTRFGGGFGVTIAGGVANPNYNPSALTNTDQIFGAAVNVASALTKQQQLFGNASFVTLAKADEPLWQLLGFAADPIREFDLIATVTVATVAGGALMVEVAYKMQ